MTATEPRTQRGRDLVAWQAGINGFDRAYWDKRVREIEEQAIAIGRAEASGAATSASSEAEGLDVEAVRLRGTLALIADGRGPAREMAAAALDATPPTSGSHEPEGLPAAPAALDASDPVAQAKFVLHRYAHSTEDAQQINGLVDVLAARLSSPPAAHYVGDDCTEDDLGHFDALERAAAPAALNGRAIHAAWRDGMLRQGRDVAPERMAWDTLSDEDKALDDWIAARLSSSEASDDAG